MQINRPINLAKFFSPIIKEVRSYAASMIAHLWKRLMLNQELSKISPNLLLPIITREMENEESDLFIEYFFNCMYLFCLYIFVIFFKVKNTYVSHP